MVFQNFPHILKPGDDIAKTKVFSVDRSCGSGGGIVRISQPEGDKNL